jgi:hypothetical protein
MQENGKQWPAGTGTNLMKDESIRLFDAERTALGALLTLLAGMVLRLMGIL